MEKSGTRFSVCFRCPQPRSAAPRILGKAADLSPTPTNCGSLSANPSLPLIVFPGLSAKIFWWFFPLSFGHKKADLNLFWWVPHFSATPFWTFLSPSPSVVEKKTEEKRESSHQHGPLRFSRCYWAELWLNLLVWWVQLLRVSTTADCLTTGRKTGIISLKLIEKLLPRRWRGGGKQEKLSVLGKSTLTSWMMSCYCCRKSSERPNVAGQMTRNAEIDPLLGQLTTRKNVEQVEREIWNLFPRDWRKWFRFQTWLASRLWEWLLFFKITQEVHIFKI